MFGRRKETPAKRKEQVGVGFGKRRSDATTPKAAPPGSAPAADTPEHRKPAPTPNTTLDATQRYVALCALAYAASGALQPTLVDWLRYHGGTGVSMLPMVANTLAMACVAPIKELVLDRRRRGTYAEASRWSWRAYVAGWADVDGAVKRRIGVVVVMDFCANFLVMLGLLFVGSGIYAVLFSSSIAFAALFSRLVGGKRFSLTQWFGVGLVTLGMALNGAASMEDALGRGAKALFKTEVGAGTIIAGSVLHSIMLVYAETAVAGHAAPAEPAADALLEKAPEDATADDDGASSDRERPPTPSGGRGSLDDEPPPPAGEPRPLTAFRLATYLGVVEASVLLAHNATLLAHHGADRLYFRSIREHGSTPSNVFSIYACLWAADLAHALAHYALLEAAGAVSIAISRGVQMVFVVGISAAAFCDGDAAQCLTPIKVVSVTNVVAGIAFYARGSAGKRNTK